MNAHRILEMLSYSFVWDSLSVVHILIRLILTYIPAVNISYRLILHFFSVYIDCK